MCWCFLFITDINPFQSTQESMFSSSLQSAPIVILPPHQKHRNKKSLQVRARSMRSDEGRQNNLVDSNMKVLKDRIEELRAKERLERSCRRDEHGWNYAPSTTAYYKHLKPAQNLSQYFETLGLAGGISGLTILTASALICLVSFMAHFHL